MITQERLKELFEYDPETGWFTNRFTRGRAIAGCRTGYLDVHGYRRATMDYTRYYEHHLAWFYVHGKWPDEVDHRDGDRSNNAISNLRLATRTQNCFNADRNTGMSGLRGAYLDCRNLQWYSKIQIGGQVTWLGSFNSAEEAHKAFMKAVEHHHGEFASRNRNSS